eukprot:1268617-Amphidinium_carterae.1
MPSVGIHRRHKRDGPVGVQGTIQEPKVEGHSWQLLSVSLYRAVLWASAPRLHARRAPATEGGVTRAFVLVHFSAGWRVRQVACSNRSCLLLLLVHVVAFGSGRSVGPYA